MLSDKRQNRSIVTHARVFGRTPRGRRAPPRPRGRSTRSQAPRTSMPRTSARTLRYLPAAAAAAQERRETREGRVLAHRDSKLHVFGRSADGLHESLSSLFSSFWSAHPSARERLGTSPSTRQLQRALRAGRITPCHSCAFACCDWCSGMMDPGGWQEVWGKPPPTVELPTAPLAL